MKTLKTYNQLFEGKNEDYTIDIDMVVNDELNDSLMEIQGFIGQKWGDTAGVFFSEYDDAEEYWDECKTYERIEILIGYVEREDSDDNVNHEKCEWLIDVLVDLRDDTHKVEIKSDRMKQHINSIRKNLKVIDFNL